VLGLDEAEGPGNDEEAAHDWIWIRFNGGEWNKFQWSSPDRQFFRHLKRLEVRISKNEPMQVYKAPVPFPHQGHERASASACNKSIERRICQDLHISSRHKRKEHTFSICMFKFLMPLHISTALPRAQRPPIATRSLFLLRPERVLCSGCILLRDISRTLIPSRGALGSYRGAHK
jgi:hypothetical protein